MFCTNCGTALQPTDNVCINCGQAIAAQPTPSVEAVSDTTALTADEALRQIAAAALRRLQPLIPQQPEATSYMINLKSSDKYTDSFMRGTRKKPGFFSKPDASTPMSEVDVMITFRPGALSPTLHQWIGYSLTIANPATNPSITVFREWPESGNEYDVTDPTTITKVTPHLLALIKDAEPTPGNAAPPREAPETMF